MRRQICVVLEEDAAGVFLSVEDNLAAITIGTTLSRIPLGPGRLALVFPIIVAGTAS